MAAIETSSPAEAATNAEDLSQAVVKSLDDLGKKLRALENIPLDISSVQGKQISMIYFFENLFFL